MAARVLSFQAPMQPAAASQAAGGSKHVLAMRRSLRLVPEVMPRPVLGSSAAVAPALQAAAVSFPTPDPLDPDATMLAKVQGEWPNGYVEVEVGGLTLRRLGCIYLAAAQQTRFRILQGVRSFFHLTPAH